MTRKAALKLSFTPDDYLATWRLPARDGGTVDAHGSLTVEAGKPPKGTAHGDLDGHLQEVAGGVMTFPQSISTPVIAGDLSTGASVLLVNARVSHWFPGRAHLDADAAILTLSPVDGSGEPVFNSFDIQVTGLDAVAGVGPIKSTNFPKVGAAGTWSAELSADFDQEWADAGASMSLTYYGSFRSFDPYAFSMSFSPVLTCKLADPVPLRRLLDDWINPLRRVVSIGTGRPEDITYLSVNPVSDEGPKRRGQVFGAGITQEPYESSQDEIRKVKAPLRLKQDGVSLLELVRAWQQLASAHHPLLETYGSMLHARDQHPRSRFLLLVQAIEGTHGHETKASFAKRQAKHTQVRDQVLTLATAVLDAQQRKFLDRTLSKRPPGGLEPALNWLAKKLPGDPKTRLDAAPLIAALRTGSGGAKNAPDALRIIRNNLAHGTKGYEAYEIHQVVMVLEQMVRAHALDVLGCPASVVSRAVDPS